MEVAKDLIIAITGIMSIVFHPNFYRVVAWFVYTTKNFFFGSEEFLNVKPAIMFRMKKKYINNLCRDHIFKLSKQYDELSSEEINKAVDRLSLGRMEFWYYIHKYFHKEGLLLFYKLKSSVYEG